jgi:hypothetical protein
MPIIGMTLNKIEAKKNEEMSGAVKLNSNMNITDVKEEDLAALNCKGLSIMFDFSIKYATEKNKASAEINLNGSVIYTGADNEKIMKDWKKDKKLPDDLKIQVVRIVSEKCSKKAIMLSDDLQLPPPPLLMTSQQPAPAKAEK